MPEASLLLALLLGVQVIISDLYARRVSNRWLLLTLAAAALAMLVFPTRSTAPGAALLGLLIGLLSLLPFYAIGWMGAGDVKLFATLGFVLGSSHLLPLWIGASLLAGAHALAVIVSRRLMTSGIRGLAVPLSMSQQRLHKTEVWRQAMQARQGRKGIPYAAYLGITTLALSCMEVSGV